MLHRDSAAGEHRVESDSLLGEIQGRQEQRKLLR